MLEHVCQLARNAGDAIMQVYDGIKPIEITSKQDDSPVTAADIAAHTVILEGLQALTPDIPVLSEEAPPGWDIRQHWQRYWLVDPLDGTKEFIKRNGEFTVNIALIEKGKPVLGVVYAPVMNVMYSAAEGKAWKEEMAEDVYERVLSRMERQLSNAIEWRDRVNTYFYRKSGVKDALSRKIYE